MLRLRATESLKIARKAANIKQREMPALVEIDLGKSAAVWGKSHRSWYSQVELGMRGVSQEIAIAISRIVQKPVEEVFTNLNDRRYKEHKHAATPDDR